MDPSLNPFSTRSIFPGAIEYCFFETDHNLVQLIDEIKQRCQGLAAIVGPHGSGKSTLLASLQPQLEEIYGEFKMLRISQLEPFRFVAIGNAKLVVIDGFEQLRWFDRARLVWRAKHGELSLIVTTHKPSRWIPTLYRTSTNLVQAQQLLVRLLKDRPDLYESFSQRLSELWPIHSPNLRDAFFSLYDFYEERIRTSSNLQKPQLD